MVSAQDEREVMTDERIFYDARQFLAGFSDLRDVFCVGGAGVGEAFGLRYVYVAEVGYVVVEG
jgi:hypothetical protein